MSQSHKINCNHDEIKNTIYTGCGYCTNCGTKFRMVPNGPDDFDWEEVGT